MKVLFLCNHNSGRSQIAEAFVRQIANRNLQAVSAGTNPSDSLNKIVVAAMLELDIDISDQRPKMVTQEMVYQSDRLISMGCSPEQDCSVLFTPDEDWVLDDPQGQPLDVVRDIRDNILLKVQNLSQKLNS